MRYSLDQINQMSQAEFVMLLGDIFEETPAVAQQTWAARPFADISALHRAMVDVVEHMSQAEKVALIRAHPELGSRAKMAAASVREQTSTGLTQLNSQDYDRLQALNAAYNEKFGFPFVMAVKGHGVESILTTFQARSQHDKATEMARSLSEIAKIARFRLDDLLV